MARSYRQLDVEARCAIARLSGEGHSLRHIAAALCRAPSTIARELKRNTGSTVGYQPCYAEQLARARRWNGSKLDRDQSLRQRVLGELSQGWSPEQIVGRARRCDGKPLIGVETIYRFIYAQITRHNDYSWRHYLPRAKFKRGRRPSRGGSSALHMILRRPLDERPAEAAHRRVPGHWEADLMAFAKHGHSILFLHERTSRALIGTRLSSKHAAPVVRASTRRSPRCRQACARP